MKSPGDDVQDVEDDVLDQDLIEESADWGASDWDDDKGDQLTCSEKARMTRQAIEDWHEQRRIERELDELLD
ncbi:MAG: hypothetical protein HON25_02675 [Gammaproteobacteria bacterium]|jgi:hypothetical protein|nr:hypothetical protein [Gammaproteobacteria bacterium]MDG1125540.1 hypothetical protein [Pseudomonadales bacterium]MBT3694948.1 hypothetical protein [Gammaproteobacteria bacterium]MBT5682801.1 hypothetical protein [Gammaproteobacteria bacterium]MBT6024372.1 hypothetical protein [Gammaproteobacteria bacterium]